MLGISYIQTMLLRNFIPFTVIGLLNVLPGSGQSTPNQTLNLSFEKTNDSGRITGCNFSTGQYDYFSYRDDSVKMEGNNSLRLQKDVSSTKEGVGFIGFSLPANFEGTEITLRGFVKTESVQEGYAGLWLRSFSSNEVFAFDNVKVIGTQDWKQYSITVSMDENVTSIGFGGILTAKGKSWFDKLEILINGKPVDSVIWLPGKVKPGRNELAASGVLIDSLLTVQQKENLYRIGKLWGFLKYHHPAVAKGDYDFDSCLFSIMPNLLKAKSNEDRDDLLIQWINTLGDENKYPVATSAGENNIHTRPQLSWLTDKHFFSEALSLRLNNIYKHRNSGSNYYVRLMSGEGNPVFTNEAIYNFVSPRDDGFRMLALFRYWNIIEYFFPYKHLLREKWSDVLREFIPSFASNRSALNYRLACLRLINRVQDTHASIYGDPILQDYFGKKGPAVTFKMLENMVIVYDYSSDSLAAFETIKPGDEIITVNGRKIEDSRKIVNSYLCASNASVANRNFIDNFLFKSNDDSLLITYKREGKSKKSFLRLYSPGQVAYQNGDNWRMPMYKLISPAIGYINLGKIEADSLPKIFKAFEKTKRIIIDIRNYPNDFMPFELGEYIKTSSTPFVKFTNVHINNPGLFSFTTPINNGSEGEDKINSYKGLIVILVNEKSQSQAEYTTMALRTAPRSVVMGSQTAGADGDASKV